jgi:VWFA-related protein
MIQGFTPDENILARALKNNKGSLSYSGLLGEEATDRMLVDWLQQNATKNLAHFGANAGASSNALLDMAGRMEQDMAERRSRDLESRMALTTDAFTHLARYLSALPGRKSLIWLSGSFPLGIFPGMDFRNPYSENKTETEKMTQAVNLLAESHVAIYPVDVRGLNSYALSASADSSGIDLSQSAAPPSSQSALPPPSQFNSQASNTQRFDELSNLNSAGGIGPNLPNGSPFMDQAMDHGIMDQIAADTGGKAFYNANGIEHAMTIAMEQESNYYALSYTPLNRKYDGKFRKIKVSLASSEKKYHLIHRSGYYAVDPDAPSPLSKDATTGFGLASMQHDAPQSRQLLFEARVVPIGKPMLEMDPRTAHPVASHKKKKHQDAEPPKPIEMQRYELDYAITPSQLHFDLTPDGFEHGAMNFMVASFDADGSVRTSIASHVKGDLKPDEYNDVMIGGFRLHEDVDIPVAAASLRMGVQDAITGRLGTIEIPLPVKAPPGVEQSRSQKMPEIEPD